MKRAIFLDRDGVINRKPPEHGYVKSWSEFHWLPTAKQAIKLINQSDYLAVIISNQRGVARGLMSSEDVEKIYTRIQQDLSKIGTRLDAAYWCYHDDLHGCDCRKPKPGLILKAAADLNIDLFNSWVIGDEEKDIKAGKAAGCKTFLVDTNCHLLPIIEAILRR